MSVHKLSLFCLRSYISVLHKGNTLPSWSELLNEHKTHIFKYISVEMLRNWCFIVMEITIFFPLDLPSPVVWWWAFVWLVGCLFHVCVCVLFGLVVFFFKRNITYQLYIDICQSGIKNMHIYSDIYTAIHVHMYTYMYVHIHTHRYVHICLSKYMVDNNMCKLLYYCIVQLQM